MLLLRAPRLPGGRTRWWRLALLLECTSEPELDSPKAGAFEHRFGGTVARATRGTQRRRVLTSREGGGNLDELAGDAELLEAPLGDDAAQDGLLPGELDDGYADGNPIQLGVDPPRGRGAQLRGDEHRLHVASLVGGRLSRESHPRVVRRSVAEHDLAITRFGAEVGGRHRARRVALRRRARGFVGST